MKFELLEYLITCSSVSEMSMVKFEANHTSKEEGSLIFASEFVLNCGIASDKGICTLCRFALI